jgi:hypothetical protein
VQDSEELNEASYDDYIENDDCGDDQNLAEQGRKLQYVCKENEWVPWLDQQPGDDTD